MPCRRGRKTPAGSFGAERHDGVALGRDKGGDQSGHEGEHDADGDEEHRVQRGLIPPWTW